MHTEQKQEFMEETSSEERGVAEDPTAESPPTPDPSPAAPDAPGEPGAPAAPNVDPAGPGDQPDAEPNDGEGEDSA